MSDLSEKMMLLNASNLHVGGGIQVAVSIIDELSRFEELPRNLVIWASTEVHQNLVSSGVCLDKCANYKVKNSYGIRMMFSAMGKEISCFGSVYTVFGPLYALKTPPYSIVGFAQGWILWPDVAAVGFYRSLISRIKFRIQKFFFQRAHMLVVELEHVKRRLLEQEIASDKDVVVVHNCLSSIYADESKWLPIDLSKVNANLHFGVVGRNYAHKNTGILPEVKKILKDKFNLEVAIYVTFTAAEWSVCSESFKRAIVNVGELEVAQCPAFYREMDGVIFPSLLECFSATPLEAMAMGKPLFAGDRGFNRDICGDYAFYFDPTDAGSIAQSVADFFRATPAAFDQKKRAAIQHAFSFASPRARARMCVSLLQSYSSRNID